MCSLTGHRVRGVLKHFNFLYCLRSLFFCLALVNVCVWSVVAQDSKCACVYSNAAVSNLQSGKKNNFYY